MTTEERLNRWRLILGRESDERFAPMGAAPLSAEELLMDQALAAIYGGPGESFSAGGRGAGNGPSSPHIAKWLGDLRSLFPQDIVAVVQNDAIERKGLKQLLLEPELLDNLEPDLNLASTLLMLKDHIPKKSKESARRFIAKIVEDINRMLESDMRRAVTAALNRRAHSPLPSASAIDFPYTIRRNLRHYHPQLKTIVPERVYFFDRSSRTNRWNVILDIDQSGSMASSVVYSSIFGAVMASMPAVKTHLVVFDTAVVDMTEQLDDPVDLLFGVQLGGGTDINRAVGYCQSLIRDPRNTILVLISDLYEGGVEKNLLQRANELVQSGVQVITLLALSNEGTPFYDKALAAKLAGLGIPSFACTPDLFPGMMAAAIRKEDVNLWAAKQGIVVPKG